MAGADLKYNLPLISRNDFDMFHTFVQSVFDEGQQRFSPWLRLISNDSKDFFGVVHLDDLEKTTSLGVCIEPGSCYQKSFNIWISPSYREPLFKFWMTLAHELTHGYAGLKYGHNAHWRRWFYRVLWHLNQTDLMPKPESSLFWVCVSMEHQYNLNPKIDPALTINEAFSKAESEHDKVLENYIRRLTYAESVDCSGC